MTNFEEYAKDRDTEYKGKFNEDGFPWDGDLGWYTRSGDTSIYNVRMKEDGQLECWYVLLGSGNVRVSIDDELKYEPTMTKQEWYQWLLDNRSNYDDQGYEEVKYG